MALATLQVVGEDSISEFDFNFQTDSDKSCVRERATNDRSNLNRAYNDNTSSDNDCIANVIDDGCYKHTDSDKLGSCTNLRGGTENSTNSNPKPKSRKIEDMGIDLSKCELNP